MLDDENTPYQLFICYARADRSALESLIRHISILEKNKLIKVWYDREITGGKNWDSEIRINLKSADIVLLLISTDFFASDYIQSVELEEALERDKNKEALVVPVILKKCVWNTDARISALQALPESARPVYDKNHWPEPDDAFYDIANGLIRIIKDPETANRRQKKIERIEGRKILKEMKDKFADYDPELKKLAEDMIDKYANSELELIKIFKEAGDRVANSAEPTRLKGKCNIQRCANKGMSTATKGNLHIVLIQGNDEKKNHVFAYLAIREEDIQSLLEANDSGIFYPIDYGVVIEEGSEYELAKAMKIMEEEYGFDHKDMEKLT